MKHIVAFIFVVLVSACHQSVPDLKSVPVEVSASDYSKVYRAWTREADRFSVREMSDVLRVSATFESAQFRSAYVSRYAKDLGLTQEAYRELLQAEHLEAAKEHRFYVTLVGADFRESNLAHQRAAWTVWLLDDRGHQTEPSSIKRIKRPNAVDRRYFPTTSPHRQTMRISFPALDEEGAPNIAADARVLLLRFTGPLGRVDLKWELRP